METKNVADIKQAQKQNKSNDREGLFTNAFRKTGIFLSGVAAFSMLTLVPLQKAQAQTYTTPPQYLQTHQSPASIPVIQETPKSDLIISGLRYTYGTNGIINGMSLNIRENGSVPYAAVMYVTTARGIFQYNTEKFSGSAEFTTYFDQQSIQDAYNTNRIQVVTNHPQNVPEGKAILTAYLKPIGFGNASQDTMVNVMVDNYALSNLNPDYVSSPNPQGYWSIVLMPEGSFWSFWSTYNNGYVSSYSSWFNEWCTNNGCYSSGGYSSSYYSNGYSEYFSYYWNSSSVNERSNWQQNTSVQERQRGSTRNQNVQGNKAQGSKNMSQQKYHPQIQPRGPQPDYHPQQPNRNQQHTYVPQQHYTPQQHYVPQRHYAPPKHYTQVKRR